MALPRAFVSQVVPRKQGDGYQFEADLPGDDVRIYVRYRWSEAVVDRASTIVDLANRGFEVIYETGPGEQSARLSIAEPGNTQGEPARMNNQ